MEENKVIETIGSITKMEHLRSVETGPLVNTLVLNNITPFPGIKSEDFNERSSLGSFFIVLRYRYAPEKINRINSSLFKDKKLNRYPSFGEIITHDSILPCIRLKETSISELSGIQEYLRNNTLQMMAYKFFDQQSRIKIFKTFKLVETSNGIYRDLNEGEKFYLQYSGELNWKRFEYIVKKIKFDCKNKEFDAALGVIYRFCGPQNVIRIYDKDKTAERALTLRKLFITEIKKEINISTFHE
ncbi:MAG: hypothetical protein IPM71_07670 [Bacteroidota bacterium]|nr:MAG: hypothetical protein IPM71_07670 [Bacteroidota bacterium]